jgi:hypothetical protein
MPYALYKNELLRQLFLAKWIGNYDPRSINDGTLPPTSQNICKAYGISQATLKRDIAQLRHYGMEVYAHSRLGYICANWDDVKRIATNWLRDEIDRFERLCNTEHMFRED